MPRMTLVTMFAMLKTTTVVLFLLSCLLLQAGLALLDSSFQYYSLMRWARDDDGEDSEDEHGRFWALRVMTTLTCT